MEKLFKTNGQKKDQDNLFFISPEMKLYFFQNLAHEGENVPMKGEDAPMKGDFNYVKIWYMTSMASLLVFCLCIVGL